MIASAYSQRQRVEQGRRVVRDIAFAIALEKTERRLRLAARHGGEAASSSNSPSPGMARSASSAIANVSRFRVASASRSRAIQCERWRAASSGKSGKDG